MSEADRAAIERGLAASCERGDHAAAATLALRTYGSEILRFLLAVTRDAGDADEAFAAFTLLFWEQLPRFRRACSFRTWAYILARTALAQLRAGKRRGRREVTLSREAADVAAEVRSRTREYLRTDARDRLARVVAGLDEEQRMLLILRVQRRLSWAEVTRIVAGDEPLDEPALARRAAALRKRFERLKEILRAELPGAG